MNLKDMSKEQMVSLMRAGICPNCFTPTHKKNGKETHPKQKKKICENAIREKFNLIRTEKIKLQTGEEVEMRAQVMTKEEAMKL